MLKFYEEGYTYEMDIAQNVKGRKIQYVKLNPIDTNSEIKHVLLGIDANSKHIYNLIEIGKNGTKTTLTVNSFKTDEPLSKTLFTFDEINIVITLSIKLTKCTSHTVRDWVILVIILLKDCKFENIR